MKIKNNNLFNSYNNKCRVMDSNYRYTKLNWHSLIFDIIGSRSVHHSITFGVY